MSARQSLPANLFFKARQVFDESADDLRIILGASARLNQRDGLVTRQALAVLPVFARGVEAIHYREDSRRQRNLFAAQAVRVARAIPTLVMMSHDGNDRIREADALQYLCADRGVHFHLLELGVRELSRLVEDVIGHGELANIMQQRAGLQRFDLKLGKLEGLAHACRINLYAVNVV